MKNINPTTLLTLTLLNLAIISSSHDACAHNFLVCLHKQSNNYFSSISNDLYTPTNSSYSTILQDSIRNLRFAGDSTPKPLAIITPEHESQIPPIIHCAKASGTQIRTRSGGHDYEGLSYVAKAPFVVIDLVNLSQITVNIEEKTAWVGAGATIGSLYATIAEKSPILAFPAGTYPTVGVGGHFSGGGVGSLLRKYGLSADNVVDARIIDVDGRILDRESMGEDVFWAIRGGGAASFGVVAAWKVPLVDVPERVSFFNIERTLEQNATLLLHRWQCIAPKLNEDLIIKAIIRRANSTITVSFNSLFLGGTQRLLVLMHEGFPELGLVREDCMEMSWIQSMVYEAGYPIESSPQVVLKNPNVFRAYLKGKSDYVRIPVPLSGYEGLWRVLFEAEGGQAMIQLIPYGGRMAETSESAIPFPHRGGVLYEVLAMVLWEEEENRDSDKYIRWIRRLENYLTPYVSRAPREAYLNVRDLDLGTNNVVGETNYARASVWGRRYFKNNFDRLVRVKTVFDPNNFFKNEQSIPPLQSRSAE